MFTPLVHYKPREFGYGRYTYSLGQIAKTWRSAVVAPVLKPATTSWNLSIFSCDIIMTHMFLGFFRMARTYMWRTEVHLGQQPIIVFVRSCQQWRLDTLQHYQYLFRVGSLLTFTFRNMSATGIPKGIQLVSGRKKCSTFSWLLPRRDKARAEYRNKWIVDEC